MEPRLLAETVMGLLKSPAPPIVIDVRKRPAFEADPAMLPGAVWRDPQSVARWATELPSGCFGRRLLRPRPRGEPGRA
jgi:hypothetical protein